jgi:hypothetical protein
VILKTLLSKSSECRSLSPFFSNRSFVFVARHFPYALPPHPVLPKNKKATIINIDDRGKGFFQQPTCPYTIGMRLVVSRNGTINSIHMRYRSTLPISTHVCQIIN